MSSFFVKKLNRSLRMKILLLGGFIVFASFVMFKERQKPVIFLIGDSTVKNGKGKGDNQLWGWGSFLAGYVDTAKVTIENHALGGTSSRTFRTKGLWDEVLKKVKPGDYVIMQFGHNDSGPLDDTARARGTIKGIGDEVKEIYNPITKQNETVHTYGWYMRAYIRETKEKGAEAIVCSPVPRNSWKDNHVVEGAEGYAEWAEKAASGSGAYFIDLNKIVAEKYNKLGQDKVNSFFPADHTHTNREGALINAASVCEGLNRIPQLALRGFVKDLDE